MGKGERCSHFLAYKGEEWSELRRELAVGHCDHFSGVVNGEGDEERKKRGKKMRM
jgi:hypothetical protein